MKLIVRLRLPYTQRDANFQLIRHMSIRFFTMAAMLLAGLATEGLAKETITWGLVNFAPKNLSRTDLARNFISEKLTNYAHETIDAPIPRIVSEIKGGTHWCWAGAIKNSEREEFSYLSAPFIFTFPQRIIVRKNRLAEFATNGTLSLESLLQDRSKKTSVARSRVYNTTIDALLKRYPPPQATSSIAEAVQMLLADRLDYVLEDAGVARTHADQLGQVDGLAALTFKEMGDLVLGRVMCPKSDWGKQVINEINGVLRTERGSARYRSIVETYHDDDERRALRQVYDEMFLKSE